MGNERVVVMCGDCVERLKTLGDRSVQCCVTSPPYWGLRDYGVAGQMGLEGTPEEYVAKMVEVFREVRRVLRDDGTLWLNLGDSYVSNAGSQAPQTKDHPGSGYCGPNRNGETGLQPKNLIGIPWRVAFALQADGWYLRSDIIWHKPNPMPESVTDRPTKAHEYIFLLTKQSRYYYDAEAVKEPLATEPHTPGNKLHADKISGPNDRNGHSQWETSMDKVWGASGYRNKRSVWTVPSQPYPESHFATFPEDLVKPCILAGTSAKGCCPQCGAPWERVVENGVPCPEPSHRNPPKRLDPGQAGNVGNGNMGFRASKLSGKEMSQWKAEHPDKTTDWQPTCACGCGGLEPDDFDVIQSPTGERVGYDPSLETGRAGMNRPRGDSEGTRQITRFEQRKYAKQLKDSDHSSEMESEAGEAFAHYIRTDPSGARPVPQDLLENWITRGWISWVNPPARNPLPPVPCTVLDPFAGSGTTGQVALELGRKAVLIELNPKYVELIKQRTNVTPGLLLA